MFMAFKGTPVGINAMSTDVFIERIEMADAYIEPLRSRADYQVWRIRFHNLFSGLSPDKLEFIRQKPLAEAMKLVLVMLKAPGGENLERKNPILNIFE